jgi:hypothetical protein
MATEVDPFMLTSNVMVKGLSSVLIIIHQLAFQGHKLMKDCRKTMTYQEIEARAESLYVHPCCLKSEFNTLYQGMALINVILISDDEIRRMHGRRDGDEDSLSFDACRSRRLANLSGVHQRNELIPSWEDHLMHEEVCRDGSKDFAPFDKDTIPVCVLTENSSYYIQDFKNYFDCHYTSLGNFWDYTNENLTADQVAMTKKINMGKNQVNAIMTYISFNRLCLTNLMSPHDLVPNMKVYLVQLLAMIIDVLLRHCRRLFNYTKVIENKLLREWDDKESAGIHVDPPTFLNPNICYHNSLTLLKRVTKSLMQRTLIGCFPNWLSGCGIVLSTMVYLGRGVMVSQVES